MTTNLKVNTKRLAKKLEAEIQSEYIKYLNGKKYIKVTRHHPTKAGEPDTICCIYGMYVEIEFKKIDGKQSAMQKLSMKKCIAAGGRYWLIKGLTQLQRKINRLSKKL